MSFEYVRVASSEVCSGVLLSWRNSNDPVLSLFLPFSLYFSFLWLGLESLQVWVGMEWNGTERSIWEVGEAGI